MKRLVAILLAMVLLLGIFSACGKNANNSGSTNATVLKIGSIGPGTGDASTYGNAVKYGSELAVEEINAAGGINGVKIEFQFEDDECDSEKSVNAYNTLKDWGMQERLHQHVALLLYLKQLTMRFLFSLHLQQLLKV